MKAQPFSFILHPLSLCDFSWICARHSSCLDSPEFACAEEPARVFFSAGQPWILTAGLAFASQWTWQRFPPPHTHTFFLSCHWEKTRALRKISPLSHTHTHTQNTEPSINNWFMPDPVSTVSKTVVAWSPSPNAIWAPTCKCDALCDKQHATRSKSKRGKKKPRLNASCRLLRCGGAAQNVCSVLRFWCASPPPPSPSAVPLIFHIRLLIITASRTICSSANLRSLFQINISRQVKCHWNSLCDPPSSLSLSPRPVSL